MMTLAWTLTHQLTPGMRISHAPTRILIVDDQDQDTQNHGISLGLHDHFLRAVAI